MIDASVQTHLDDGFPFAHSNCALVKAYGEKNQEWPCTSGKVCCLVSLYSVVTNCTGVGAKTAEKILASLVFLLIVLVRYVMCCSARRVYDEQLYGL